MAITKNKSYQSILKAIIDGQTDPDELLRLVHGRIINKHGRERVKAALTGSFSETDLIVLRQLKKTLDLIEEQRYGKNRKQNQHSLPTKDWVKYLPNPKRTLPEPLFSAKL